AFAQNFARTISTSAPNFAEPGAHATSPATVTNAGQTGFKDGMSTFAGAPPRSAAPVGSPDGGAQGGVQVALPDGSVAVAPNEQAAGAVRSALTQQGTPYSWGGTEPGRGLDCSGLTQWAYREQGVELPRLAQEQNVGTQVSRDEVLPGDLAVWDGHVAMVVGNNQLVEAGDPVQVGDIRTTNSGMAFMGFYRPTA
ncbi:MAG: C40 family peptidase, partial [Rhodococcus sp. (in: high G+C Gram-positive bacteria)]